MPFTDMLRPFTPLGEGFSAEIALVGAPLPVNALDVADETTTRGEVAGALGTTEGLGCRWTGGLAAGNGGYLVRGPRWCPPRGLRVGGEA